MKKLIIRIIKKVAKIFLEDIMSELEYLKSENMKLKENINELGCDNALLRYYVVELQSDFSRYHTAWQRLAMLEATPIHSNKLKTIHSLFPVCEIDLPLKRIGNTGDGGYVMVDDFINKKIAYSFGICDDVSWDMGIVSAGISRVYMYDHTIESLPEENAAFSWHKEGITGIYDSSKPELKSLEQFLLENNHTCEDGIILKMDVEGAEWEVLENTQSEIWDKFSQITMEMHWILNEANYSKIVNALKNINKTHIPIYVHGNNNRGYELGYGYTVPDVLEVTYVNIREYKNHIRNKKMEYPAEFDKKNNSLRSEIILGRWGKD
ncbi:FkbM family methyltransferase [Anaerovibrio slackiae]|uniref:FkbM family methyltransferase n=1 Tax=Anaerovibrio slackiae TaxID=2652309 RepID=UPI003F176712